MRVSLDATPLLGRPTGVGTYVAGLVGGLTTTPVELSLTPFSLRGTERPPSVPPSVPWRTRPVPARLLQTMWQRSTLPPVEWLAGRSDVFHATNFVLPPRRRARGVVTVHDLTFDRHPEWVQGPVLRYRNLVPRSLDAADLVLTPSRAVADEITARYGLSEERVRVTPLGVDPSWAAARPLPGDELARRGLPTEYVVFAGAREPRKNLATLLEAYRRAGPTLPPLLLVGPEGWGETLGSLPGVHVSGWLPAEDLRGVISRAAALVLPSWYEGFGLPVLEAMAAGTPVVASDIPTHREIGGGHARLVDPGDPDALAAALAEVSASPPPAEATAAARAWAAGFTWETCAAETLQAYRDALA